MLLLPLPNYNAQSSTGLQIARYSIPRELTRNRQLFSSLQYSPVANTASVLHFKISLPDLTKLNKLVENGRLLNLKQQISPFMHRTGQDIFTNLIICFHFYFSNILTLSLGHRDLHTKICYIARLDKNLKVKQKIKSLN